MRNAEHSTQRVERRMQKQKNSVFHVLCSAFGIFLAAVLSSTANPADIAEDADAAYAERILREAGAATDDRGVLAYIRAHTLTEEELDRLARAVRFLGDEEFRVREDASRQLIAAGRSALPFLSPAIHDPDPEIARRAKRCIEAIRRTPSSPLMAAAAQLVKSRRPSGASAVLLAYLPCIDEPATIETWFDTLDVVGWQGDRPDAALLAALTDKRSIRRAAVAHVLGRSASDEVRRLVRPLLADPDARVRYEAAASLVRYGEKSAIRTLVALLTDAPLPVAAQAEDLLSCIAEGEGPATALSKSQAARVRLRMAWENWWRDHAGEVDLDRLRQEEPPRGRTVVCEYDGVGGGRVWEWGRDGKQRWEITHLQGPNDVRILAGGRVLIAERNANRVTERDHYGTILWEHRTSGQPISCQRLANGNTLVATFNELYEVTIDQKKIFSRSHIEGFRHAVQLRDGRIVYITGHGRVVELDAKNKQRVRTIQPENYARGATYWASVEPLPHARYLLALGGANRVIEIDASGKIRWEAIVHSAVFATRLRNGHTLVSCFGENCVLELDRTGKEVNKQRLRGRPFVVRRY
jgi:HEAT repeat protein